MKLKCIIFDVDGTMADTERDGHRVAFNLAFAEKSLGWYWDEELYGELLNVTGGKERMKHYQKNFLSQIKLSDNDIKILHKCKTKHYVNLLESGNIPLRNGVKKLIEEAQLENITLAISTTTTPVNVTTLLNTAFGKNAINIFKVIAAGDIVENKKPAPDIYNFALDKLNIKSENCIAIEDSNIGLNSAVQAGIKTIVTTNQYTQHQNFSKAEAVYPNFKQININLMNNIIGNNHV